MARAASLSKGRMFPELPLPKARASGPQNLMNIAGSVGSQRPGKYGTKLCGLLEMLVACDVLCTAH